MDFSNLNSSRIVQASMICSRIRNSSKKLSEKECVRTDFDVFYHDWLFSIKLILNCCFDIYMISSIYVIYCIT